MKTTSSLASISRDAKLSSFSQMVELISGSVGETLAKEQLQHAKHKAQEIGLIAFIAPLLPHPCELEIWNHFLKKLGNKGTLYTSRGEEKNFAAFCEILKMAGEPLRLQCKYLEGMDENSLFLAGLENELKDANIIFSVGESSLASYQALKAKRQYHNRLIIWQNAPRPRHATFSSLQGNSPLQVQEHTIRKEILKNCDILICPDKDSASWAFLENVDAQRIRKVSRGLNTQIFNDEINVTKRFALRKSLNLPETDFIFLQMGPLEIEAGCLDSVYAFKNLLQSNQRFLGQVKLCFCGTGSAATDIRQTIVELGLDDHVYFINPNSPNTRQTIGNQLSNLISLCDAVIHNPIHPVNSAPTKLLDCTYDILCALGSGITVISNAHGWIGEWLGRFYKTFSPCHIHGQARLMQQAIEKQEKLVSIKQAIKKSLQNEFSLEDAAGDLAQIVRSLLMAETLADLDDMKAFIAHIEKMILSRQYLDAIQLISQAFAQPNLSATHQAALFRLIADSFTKLGDPENGEINYNKALTLDPYCSKSFVGLGTLCLQKNQYQNAIPYFQKAIALDPQNDMAYLGLGLSFEGLKEKKEALHWIAKSCSLNIQNTGAIFNLVKISYELESFDAALSILERYVNLHSNDVNMIYSLAGMYFKINRQADAIQLLESILTLDPKNIRAQNLLSEIHKETEQRKQA